MKRFRKVALIAILIAVAAMLILGLSLPKPNSTGGRKSLLPFLDFYKKEKWVSKSKVATVDSLKSAAPQKDDKRLGFSENSVSPLEGRSAEPDNTFSQQESSEELEEEKCWNQINEDAGNQDFYEYNKAEWDRNIGSWFLKGEPLSPNYSPTKIEAKFYYALGLAGLLRGRELDRDLPQAFEKMIEVIKEDPRNSAPLLFGAIIARKLGKLASANEFVSRAKETSYFSAYATEISRAIYSPVKSSSDFLQAIGIWSQVPIADYVELKKLLLEIGSVKFAEQMIEKGLNLNAPLNDLDWFGVEYAVGLVVLKKLDPNRKLPPYGEVVFKKNSMSDLNGDKMIKAMRETCRLTAVDPYLSLLKTHLAK